ncbi:T9SS type A sorting domain-containing protein [uncultured Fibrobacter sp.]|uniref:T9SS type A sorting domain-containing protein n=1 Tax=uncultured Fibrobacter sp. TaxID=261512 RepID=UPI0026278A72|nr:T9SS type A sorting domain-containing protein [uncultured Fibrobacter sp.]
MRISAGLTLRMVAIFLMASFSVAFAGPEVLAPKPHFNIEYYISDGEVVRTFNKSGLSIYSFMPVVRAIDAEDMDVIPYFSVVDSSGLNAMDLDSIVVKTPTQVLFYAYDDCRRKFFFQDFVKGLHEDADIQMYYSATVGKPILTNLRISNDGALPIEVMLSAIKVELLPGASDYVPFVTDVRVYPKSEGDQYPDSLYMFFSIEYNGNNSDLNPSSASLAALEALHFKKVIRSDTVDLNGVLKKALKILDDDDSIELSSILFKIEFFATSRKRLHSFVFTKDVDSTFYDESWVDSIDATAGDREFPRVYRVGACFDGWSVDNLDAGVRLFRSSDFNTMLLHREDEVLFMKPNWRYSPECAGVDVTLDADHGGAELFQVVSGDTIVHSFRDVLKVPRSSSMFTFFVRTVPDSAFVLDGMMSYKTMYNTPKLTKNGKRTEISGTLSDGGKIFVVGPTQLKARFVPGPDPEPLMVIVESGLEVSGNAARLRYSTGEMNIFRKVGFRVTVKGPEGYIVDSLLVDFAEAVVLEGEWRLVPAPVGEYVVEAKVFHDLDSARYVDTLRVAGEMAIDTGAWAMVSLSGVDMEKLKWDDDQLFYHWDESYGGAEFLQYRRLKRGSKPSAVDGYWYNSLEGRALSLAGETAGEAAFAWELDSLNSGWNLVANPHGYYVDLHADVAGDSVQFWRWNPKTREYEIPTVLGPYEAVWAKVDRAITWALDGEPVFDSLLWNGPAMTRMALAKKDENDGWELRIVLKDRQGHMDSWNILGASAREFSQEEPPSAMGDYVNLSVLGERGLHLARSVKPFAKDGAYEWTLELQAGSERDAFISVEGVAALRSSGLRVFLTVDGNTEELSDGDSVGVKLLARAREATIRVASTPKVPVTYSLNSLKFRQSPGQLHVGFVASAGLAGKPAKVELLDLQGRVVSSALFNARDGFNDANLRVARSGIFIARVKVGGQSLVSRVAIR